MALPRLKISQKWSKHPPTTIWGGVAYLSWHLERRGTPRPGEASPSQGKQRDKITVTLTQTTIVNQGIRRPEQPKRQKKTFKHRKGLTVKVYTQRANRIVRMKQNPDYA